MGPGTFDSGKDTALSFPCLDQHPAAPLLITQDTHTLGVTLAASMVQIEIEVLWRGGAAGTPPFFPCPLQALAPVPNTIVGQHGEAGLQDMERRKSG